MIQDVVYAYEGCGDNLSDGNGGSKPCDAAHTCMYCRTDAPAFWLDSYEGGEPALMMCATCAKALANVLLAVTAGA